VLSALLQTDEATDVSLLADINPRKSRELIAPLVRDDPWLANPPDAAKAISSMAAYSKWDRDPGVGRLRRENSFCSSEVGFIREYPNGLICWNGRAAFMIERVIAECYEAEGGAAGEYGFPNSSEAAAETSLGARCNVRDSKAELYSSLGGTFGGWGQ
jgi:hypothetical protein